MNAPFSRYLDAPDAPVRVNWWTRPDGGLTISLSPKDERLVDAGPLCVYLGDDTLLDETDESADVFLADDSVLTDRTRLTSYRLFERLWRRVAGAPEVELP